MSRSIYINWPVPNVVPSTTSLQEADIQRKDPERLTHDFLNATTLITEFALEYNQSMNPIAFLPLQLHARSGIIQQAGQLFRYRTPHILHPSL
jgi:hypothetical protein